MKEGTGKNKKKKNWVDFKEIKDKISLAMVLEHYSVELKKSGKNYVSCCPIHEGSNPTQFSVNYDRNIWHCFGNCNTGGNTLDFVSAMEGVSVHGAALKLKNWFLSDENTNLDTKSTPKLKTPNKEQLVREEKKEKSEQVINSPLSFKLKNLDQEHEFFESLGLLPETIEHFGLGFCTKGMMKERIAIPIHDHQGQLIAYCGRAISEELVKEEGKYKLPSSEKGFYKSHVLYNLHRQQNQDTLIVVESFKSVWHLFQMSITNVITPLGSSISEEQAELLVSHLGPKGKVIMLFDGDESGQVGTEKAVLELTKSLFVKALDVSAYAIKPHQLTKDQIDEMLKQSVTI